MTAAQRLSLILLSMAVAGAFLRAQPISSGTVSVEAEVFPQKILPGASGKLILTVIMAPGWHINAGGAPDADLIPTEFSWMPPAGFTVKQIQYPRGIPVRVEFQDEPLVVYQDEIQIVVDFMVGSTVRPGTVPLAGELTVQACSDEVCLAPSDLPVNASVEILRPIRPRKRSAR